MSVSLSLHRPISSHFSTAYLFFSCLPLLFSIFLILLVFLSVLSFLPSSNYFFYSVAPTQFLRPVFIPSPLYFSPIAFYLFPLVLSSCPSHLNIYLVVCPPTHPFLICPSIHPAFLFSSFQHYIPFFPPSASHMATSLFFFLPSIILFITFLSALFCLLFIVKKKRKQLCLPCCSALHRHKQKEKSFWRYPSQMTYTNTISKIVLNGAKDTHLDTHSHKFGIRGSDSNYSLQWSLLSFI